MVTRLSNEDVPPWLEPRQRPLQQTRHLAVAEVHQQPVAEHQVERLSTEPQSARIYCLNIRRCRGKSSVNIILCKSAAVDEMIYYISTVELSYYQFIFQQRK